MANIENRTRTVTEDVYHLEMNEKEITVMRNALSYYLDRLERIDTDYAEVVTLLRDIRDVQDRARDRDYWKR